MGGGEGDLGWKTELLGHYEVFIKHISNVISIIILLLKHYVSRCILKTLIDRCFFFFYHFTVSRLLLLSGNAVISFSNA